MKVSIQEAAVSCGTFRQYEGESDDHGEEEQLERPPLDAVDPGVPVDGGGLAQSLPRFHIVRIIPRLHPNQHEVNESTVCPKGRSTGRREGCQQVGNLCLSWDLPRNE